MGKATVSARVANSERSTLRRRLMLSASVLVASVGGYARQAVADCDPQGGGSYLCSGPTVTPQVIDVAGDVSVTTDNTFSVVSPGDGVSVSASGSISFEDLNSSSIIAAGYGLVIDNSGSGNVTITTTGDVTAGSVAIQADTQGGDISITSTGNIQAAYGIGGQVGMYNIGSVTVSSTGDITTTGGALLGQASYGNVSIKSDGNLSAGNDAISASTYSGDVSITSVGDVLTTNGSGIDGRVDLFGSGSITIASDGSISATDSAIRALSYFGDIAITSSGDLTSTQAMGIMAATAEGNLTVQSEGNIEAGYTGILASASQFNAGTGDVFITSLGNINAVGDGIFATAADGDVTIASEGDVSSESGIGIRATVSAFDGYSGSVSVASLGDIDAQYGGISATGSNGDVTVVSEGDVASDAGSGIRVYAGTYYGSSNTASVNSQGNVDAQYDGISASARNGDVTVVSEGDVSSDAGSGVSAFAGTYGSDATGSVSVVSVGNIDAGSAGILAIASGTSGDVSVTSTGNINGQYEGVFAQASNGDVTVVSDGDVSSAAATGIFATSGAYDGTSGDVSVVSIGNVDARYDGILASSANGDVAVVSDGDVSTVFGNGISAFAGNDYSGGTGSVAIASAGTIGSSYTGIRAGATGGDVAILSASDISAGQGIFADTTGENIEIVSAGLIETLGTGIFANSFNPDSEATITVAGDVIAASGFGVGVRTNSAVVSVENGVTVSSNNIPGISLGPISTGNATGLVMIGQGAVVSGGGAAIDDFDFNDANYARDTTIINSGLIDGPVFLNLGNDRFEFEAGAAVTGMVSGGEGFDTFALAGGSAGPGIDASVDATQIDGDNDGDTASGSVAVTGFELFEKIGTSTFEITGDNSEAFDFDVLEGGIIVAGELTGADVLAEAGTIVGGSGAVGALESAGTVSPGGLDADGSSTIGTLNVAGDVTLSGTLAVDVAPGNQSDLLQAGGSVTIDGADVVVSADAAEGAFDSSPSFLIVQAGGGVNGTFSNLIQDIPDITLEAVYDPNAVTLVAELDGDVPEEIKPFIAPGTGTTAKFAAPSAVAGGVDLGTGLVGTLKAAGAPVGVGGIGGGSRFALASGGSARPLEAAFQGSLVEGAGEYAADVIALDNAPVARTTGLSVIGGAFAGTIDVDDDDTRPGYDSDSVGAYVGLAGTTVMAGGALSYGALYAYAETDVDVLGGRTDIDSHQGGLFAALVRENLTVLAAAGYGDLDIETARSVDGGAVATGETDGHFLTGAVELAYNVAPLVGGSLGLSDIGVSPFVGLIGVHSEIDGFSETGSTLTVGDSEATVGFLQTGIRLERTFVANNVIYRPMAMIGYELAFGDLGASTSNDLGFGIQAFDTRVATRDPSALLVGAGLAIGSERFDVVFDYEASISDDHASHLGSVGLAVRF